MRICMAPEGRRQLNRLRNHPHASIVVTPQEFALATLARFQSFAHDQVMVMRIT